MDKLNRILTAIHDDLQVLAMVLAKEEIDIKKELNRIQKEVKQ